MTDYWFKPKTHGYGAAPLNWKGWAATIGYMAVIVPVSVWMLTPEADGTIPAARWGLWLGLLVALTSGFVWLCKIKTNGPWRWRWGTKD